MDKIMLLNKKIEEVNELNKKYKYNFNITGSVPLKYALRAETISGHIIFMRCFETLKEVYMFIEGMLNILHIQ